MSKTISLIINCSDELGITSIVYSYNDTGLPSNSETLGKIAITILKSLRLNADSLLVQDLLNELDIQVEKLK